MSKKRLTALVLTLSLLLLSACELPGASTQPTESETPPVESETPVQRAEFSLACDDSDTLDPLATTDSSNLALAGLVYEGLFELDKNFEPQPILCESWSSNSTCTVWTFTLRSDVVFSDGTPLTAKRVSSSLKAARSSDLYGERLAQIIGVSTSDNTVTITLASPNGALPSLLDIPVTLPVEDGIAPLGTGAYYYDTDGGRLVLRQNPNWRQKQTLPLDCIPLQSVTTADDRIAAFDTGLITTVTADPTSTNALGYSGSYETWTCATTNLLYLGFNYASETCQDVVLRQAISRAIDRGVIASTLFAGHADPSALPVNPASPLYDTELADELTFSVSTAAQLLADARYKLTDNGRLTYRSKPVELTLLVNSENSFRTATAGYIAEELGKLGIAVTVRELPWEDFLTALAIGDFDLYLGQVKMTADFDPAVLLTGSLNYGSFLDAETNLLDEQARLLLSAYQTATGDHRADAASALHAHLASILPFTPLCFLRTSVYTQWGAVSGLQPTQQNPFYHFHSWSID